MDLIRAMAGAPLTKAALVVLVLGWTPLLLVAAFGPEDANPVGLGLLLFLSTPIALTLAAAGVIQGWRRWKQGARR